MDVFGSRRGAFRLDAFQNGAKHSIDELAGAVATKSFGKLDGLVDRDLRRYITLVSEFEDGDPQDIAIDRGELRNWKGRGGAGEASVDVQMIQLDTPNEKGQIGKRVVVKLKVRARSGENLICAMIGYIHFIEYLNRELTRLSPVLDVLRRSVR